MDLMELKQRLPTTPAFVIDAHKMIDNLQHLAVLKQQSGCRVLYSIKALPLTFVLKLTQDYLDGFSVSSLFEAQLAHAIARRQSTIHITTPGLRKYEFEQIQQLCTHISFNALSQYTHLMQSHTTHCSLGLRVNPELSFATDARFDPCRRYSKLGEPITNLRQQPFPENIQGLHFHTVFSQTGYIPLQQTLAVIENQLGDYLPYLRWLNLGGGYLYAQIHQHQRFIQSVEQLRKRYDLEVFIEPGKSIVNDACYLISTVVDCFIRDGKQIAILDTSVNHHPEVFEYQRKPLLAEYHAEGTYTYLLVGCSCLAGDIFGEYTLKNPLKVGDRVMFTHVGAYSLIKANRFNGYNLPDVYARLDDEQILLHRSDFKDYLQQWGR